MTQPVDSAEYIQPQGYERLAEVYYHGQRQCGGHVPPQVISVHGQWTELPAGWRAGGYGHVGPAYRVLPRGYGAGVW